jgi:hypothetical protein
MRARMAQLKPEYGACYQGVDLEWHNAAWLTEVVMQRRRSEPAVWALEGRALPDDHFEFTAGPTQRRLRGCRSRRQD